MREDDRSSGRADQEAVAVPADLIADTVGALQARRDGDDRDALRGTIGPPPRLARWEPRGNPALPHRT